MDHIQGAAEPVKESLLTCTPPLRVHHEWRRVCSSGAVRIPPQDGQQAQQCRDASALEERCGAALAGLDSLREEAAALHTARADAEDQVICPARAAECCMECNLGGVASLLLGRALLDHEYRVVYQHLIA